MNSGIVKCVKAIGVQGRRVGARIQNQLAHHETALIECAREHERRGAHATAQALVEGGRRRRAAVVVVVVLAASERLVRLVHVRASVHQQLDALEVRANTCIMQRCTIL